MIMAFRMFSQRAGVRIPFQTAFHSTSVWFFDKVGTGVLETIAGIGVCLVASVHWTNVRFLACIYTFQTSNSTFYIGYKLSLYIYKYNI